MTEMHAIRVWLDKQPLGAVEYSDKLARLPWKAWDEFNGSGDERMEGYKVLSRMLEIMWEPPVLSFTIERHGRTVMSSSRAELHQWSFDLEQRTAELSRKRFCQLSRTQPRLKIEPLADDLVQSIVAGDADVRLKWLEPGRRVRVLIGKVIPSTGDDGRPLAKDTLAGRRWRMARSLESKLSAAGWSKASGTAPHT